jgi:single-strand DNA-binding protein
VVTNGKNVTQFSIATNEYRGGQEKAEFHTVVTWDRLAQICSQYLGKGQLVAIEGRIHTRQWEDDRKVRHWKTEIVASQVEMLSGRRKRDYAAESAAEALATQAAQLGMEPHELGEPPDDDEEDDLDDDVELEPEEALAAAAA